MWGHAGRVCVDVNRGWVCVEREGTCVLMCRGRNGILV